MRVVFGVLGLLIAVAIVSMFAAAYFLYAPRFSFVVANPLDLLEIIFFSMLALLASQVVSGFANDSDVARRRQPAHVTFFRAKWRSMTALWNRLLGRFDQNV